MPSPRFSVSKNGLTLALLVLAVISAGTAAYYYSQYRTLKDSAQAAPESVAEVVAKVEKIMHLPGDETPSLATVLDTEKLADQPFFANAQNGDKVLIYAKARQAIIYRESENKIITVGPVSIGEEEALDSAATSATPTPSPASSPASTPARSSSPTPAATPTPTPTSSPQAR